MSKLFLKQVQPATSKGIDLLPEITEVYIDGTLRGYVESYVGEDNPVNAYVAFNDGRLDVGHFKKGNNKDLAVQKALDAIMSYLSKHNVAA